MNIITVSGIVIILMIVAFILIGLWFKKVTVSSGDFLMAGRNIPFWLLAGSYLGSMVGGASVSGYTGLGFSDGISAIWSALFTCLGLTGFIIIFARRLNYFGRKTEAVTITDFVCARFGEKLRLPAGIIAFLRPAILTGMQLLAIAVVLNVAFGITIELGVVISAVIIFTYLYTAGQYSAIVVQWIQAMFQSLAIVVAAVAAFKLIGNPSAAAEAFYFVLPENFVNAWAVDTGNFSTWILTLGLYYFACPWMYMWAYVGESPRVSSNAQLALLGAGYYNVLPFLAGMAVMAAVTMGVLVLPDGIVGDSLYSWIALNSKSIVVGVIMIVGLVMTIISTGSSVAMNGVTILVQDIYKGVINKNASEKQLMRFSRLSVIVVLLIAVLSAIWVPVLVPLWVLAQAIVMAGLFVTVMAAWFWKHSTTSGAMAATIGGGIAAITWAVYTWVTTGSPGTLIFGLHCVHVGLAVSIILMIIVSIATNHSKQENIDATNYVVLGKAMNAEDPEHAPGLWGWLGAKTIGVKLIWIVVFTLFVLHFALIFLFHLPWAGYAMVYIAMGASIIMGIVFAIFGAKDVKTLIKRSKEAAQSQKTA